MTGRTSPNSLNPYGQGAHVNLVVRLRGARRRRMMVTVTGGQMRQIGSMFGRDMRSRHLRGAGSNLANAHLSLLTHQAGIRAIGGDKLEVSPDLHGPTFVQDQDAVGIDDARKTVSDNECRSVLHQTVERTLDGGLVFGIHAGKRLVQQQDWGVLQQRPGDRQPLALTSRESDCPLPDHGVIAMRKMRNEIVRVRGAGGILQLGLRSVRSSETQIVGNRSMEQVRVLCHDRNVVPDSAEGEFADVATVESDRPGLGIVEPVHKPDQGRFPCTARSHHTERLTFTQLERHVPERRSMPSVVAKRNPLERDPRPDFERP